MELGQSAVPAPNTDSGGAQGEQAYSTVPLPQNEAYLLRGGTLALLRNAGWPALSPALRFFDRPALEAKSDGRF
jgi:hypothetical protein